MQPSTPSLTFFCELDTPALRRLFSTPGLIKKIKELNASISLGLIDLSPERAEVVKRLNAAGIPVHAWLLLPMYQGYWFNMDNPIQAVERYQDFREWTQQNDLTWQVVGIDIEPDIRLMQTIKNGVAAGMRALLSRIRLPSRFASAPRIYTKLIQTIKADGYFAESYQLPIIIDERLAGSRLIQHLVGIINLPVDREILMLYSSFFRPHGEAILASYAAQSGGIGIGITGGGVDTEGIVDSRPLVWNELERDLRIAYKHQKPIYIFSLEGCVQQGFLDKIAGVDWQISDSQPINSYRRINQLRWIAGKILWLTAHPQVWMGVVFAGLIMVRIAKRKKDLF